MEQLLSPQDAKLVERLRAGDEVAFMELIRELNPSLLRVARMFVPTSALAEDVVQETWLAVLNGIPRFEGALLAEDMDLPHPHQHREDARRARAALGPVLDSRPRRRRL